MVAGEGYLLTVLVAWDFQESRVRIFRGQNIKTLNQGVLKLLVHVP